LPHSGRRRALKALLLTALVLVGFETQAGAEPVLKVINGRVKEIRTSEELLVLAYRHPVSGKTEELALKVSPGTGLPEGIRLEDFKKDEPLAVDYQEKPGEPPQALLVKRVPVKGVPKELAR